MTQGSNEPTREIPKSTREEDLKGFLDRSLTAEKISTIFGRALRKEGRYRGSFLAMRSFLQSFYDCLSLIETPINARSERQAKPMLRHKQTKRKGKELRLCENTGETRDLE